MNVICHGHEHAERHTLSGETAALLLQWFSGDDWANGPRCLLDVYRFIVEDNVLIPPLARH